jgi:hypothetical protein
MVDHLALARKILESSLREVQKRPFRMGEQMLPGSIISFSYKSWKHDPSPLVIVTDSTQSPITLSDGRRVNPRIRGLNLNYLPATFLTQAIQYHGQAGFSYRAIAGNKTLTNAFRHYKWVFGNITNIRIIDTEDIVRRAKIAREHDPNLNDVMNDLINQQTNEPTNISADQLAQAPTEGAPNIAGGE